MNDKYGALSQAAQNVITTYSSSSASWNQSVGTLTGQVIWNGKPVIDDDDGGSAPVREPRRPKPFAPAGSAALELTFV